jgi:two-component system sensor histidine kinase UhpB
MKTELKLLFLEDDPADAGLIQKLLQRSGLQFSSVVASDEKEFIEAIEHHKFDAVLADNALPQYNSIQALNIIKEKNPDVAFILVTGTVSEEFAVNIIQQGADDYILKTNLTRLPSALNKAIEKKKIQKAREIAEATIEKEKELSDSIINSLPAIFYLCDKNGKLLRYNSSFRILSGYTREEIINLTPSDLFKSKTTSVDEWIKNVFEKGFAELEVELASKDKHRTPYFFTGSAVSFEDQICLIGIGLDISGRKAFEKELTEINEELRSLTAHLQNVREVEQKRIAREIHDELGQQITGLKMDVSWLKKKISSNSDPLAIQQKLNSINDLLDETVQTIRKIASELRPSILDDIGLSAALEWQSREFEKRFHIKVKYNSTLSDIEIPNQVATVLFRIYQESLTNIARHAEAREVTTYFKQEGDALVLTTIDDGKGFTTNAARERKTLGMLGMHERALMINGELSINSEPGKGTTVSIKVPLQ